MAKDMIMEAMDLLNEFPKEENNENSYMTESLKRMRVDFNDPVKVKFFADSLSNLIESDEMRTHLINNLKVGYVKEDVVSQQDPKFQNYHTSAMDFL